jgi:hypothetical protein
VRVRRSALRTALPLAAVVMIAILVFAGYVSLQDHRTERSLGRWGQAGAVTAVGPTANPFGTRPAPLTGPPTRLKVPAIKLDTALETLRLGGAGELTPPKDFAKAGWYADGTVPGDVGPAVIAGHVDNRSGPAVFYDLREIVAGDTIEVSRGGVTVRFTVTSTAWYPKKEFPTADVYGPTPDRQLRLITCGGVFDRSLKSYKDNLVVYAVRS